MQQLIFSDRDSFKAQALFLGKKINLQQLENYDCLATMPVMVKAGECGCAVLLGYGVVVLFNLAPEEKAAFLSGLSSLVHDSFSNPETEAVEVHLNVVENERVKEGKIFLRELSVERLQIVADILSKSVVLSIP